MEDREMETRREMESFHDPQQAFNCWVERMCVVKQMPMSEVLNLAMVKAENKKYTGGML